MERKSISSSSPVSSSRLAYELYKHLANDDRIKDFEFEKHLPGLASGGMGPNMDVYIETADELIFIESKFTESSNGKYMHPDHEGKDGYLSPAYFLKNIYGKRKLSLNQRFWNQNIGEVFSDFCFEWQNLLDNKQEWTKKDDWFDAKQETCHLSGILGFMFDNIELIRSGKKIRLYNIYWSLYGDEMSEKVKTFIEMANEMVNSIICMNEDKLGRLDFKMDAFSIQDMLAGVKILSEHFSLRGHHTNELEIFCKEVEGQTR